MEIQDHSRDLIYEATIEEFNEKGIKFTMDDVARRLHISKKTLYNVFKDKEELFLKTIEYGFSAIKISEQEILQDKNLDIAEKIRRIIIVLPDKYRNVDFRKVSGMKEKYPTLFYEVERRIESDWEPTLNLIQQGMQEGRIKKVNPMILKAMIEATMEKFLNSDILAQNKMEYEEALNDMMEIIMGGIYENILE